MIGELAPVLDAVTTPVVVSQSARADQLEALITQTLADALAAFPLATFEGLDVSGGGDGETYTSQVIIDTAGGAGPGLADVTVVCREAGNIGPEGAARAANLCIAALRAVTAPADALAIHMGVAQAGSAGKMLFVMVGTPIPEPP